MKLNGIPGVIPNLIRADPAPLSGPALAAEGR